MCKYLPSVRLLYWLREADRIVAASAKATLSPRDFNDIAENYSSSDVEKWIHELIMRGHGSPLEHSIYVYEVICSRVCSHQLVRHRHASYSQLSQRYSDKYLRSMARKTCEILGIEYREDFTYYVEVFKKLLDENLGFNKLLEVVSESYIIPPIIVEHRDERFLEKIIESTIVYYEAISGGVPYEDARYLLPQAVKTRVVVSMNARELVEVFLPLRMCSRAQWEIRHIAWSLWRQLVDIHQAVFKYTGPRCVLYDIRTRRQPITLVDYLENRIEFTIERCPEMVPGDKILECLSSSRTIEVSKG